MSTAAPLRIAVVDDHPMTLKGLGDMADDWANGTVVLRACDGVDYEEQVATAGAGHLAIVDLRMPRRNGYETISWIRVHQPQVLILAISFFAIPDEVHHALIVGANGVVRKDIHAGGLARRPGVVAHHGPLCQRAHDATAHAHPRPR